MYEKIYDCKIYAHLDNAAEQHLVTLVLDAVSRENSIHHRNEDLVFTIELRDEGSERVHGNALQLGGRVESANERVDDARCVVGQIKGVGELVDRLQSNSGKKRALYRCVISRFIDSLFGLMCSVYHM